MPKASSTAGRIEKLLKEGRPVREVASEVKCSVRWVNSVASDRSLPKNVQIAEFGSTEQAILRLLVASNMDIDFVARAHSQAPCNIRAIISSVCAREKKVYPGELFPSTHHRRRGASR